MCRRTRAGRTCPRWTKFDEWLDNHPVHGAEITDAAIAEYLTQRYEDGKSPATCEQVVAALRFRAKLHGTASPTGPATDRVLAGIRRKGRRSGPGSGSGGEPESRPSTRPRSGRPGRHRGGPARCGPDPGRLRSDAAGRRTVGARMVDDVAFEADGSGRVTIRSSKTDQEGIGAVLFLGPTAVHRIEAWVRAAGIEEGPLFRRLHRGVSRSAIRP